MFVAKSLTLFALAGVCEIGGGYLVWQWWRNGAPLVLGVIGAAVLLLYGIIPTYQVAHFGRVYAAYGGAFVNLSVLWGWGVDPNTFASGAAVACEARESVRKSGH